MPKPRRRLGEADISPRYELLRYNVLRETIDDGTLPQELARACLESDEQSRGDETIQYAQYDSFSQTLEILLNDAYDLDTRPARGFTMRQPHPDIPFSGRILSTLRLDGEANLEALQQSPMHRRRRNPAPALPTWKPNAAMLTHEQHERQVTTIIDDASQRAAAIVSSQYYKHNHHGAMLPTVEGFTTISLEGGINHVVVNIGYIGLSNLVLGRKAWEIPTMPDKCLKRGLNTLFGANWQPEYASPIYIQEPMGDRRPLSDFLV